MSKFKLFLSIFLILNVSVFSATIHVPSERANIQSGIMWASDGDTVLVAAGNYQGVGNHDINFYGKAIHLLSESGPENTTIELDHDHRGFYFNSAEGPNSIVEGFDIYEGNVNDNDTYPDEDYGYGGAVYIRDASPTFKNCKIRNSYAKYRGSGIFIWDNANPTIDNCYFQYNTNSSDWREGGAIAIENASASIKNSSFYQNGTYTDYDGGAIYIRSSEDENDYFVDIDNNYFERNGNTSGGSRGGAIWIYRTTVDINDSHFFKNYGGGEGGAIYISQDSYTGQDDSTYHNIHINNSFFDFNGRDSDRGGAIYKSHQGDTLYIDNSKFTRNGWSTDKGGAIYLDRTKAVINNSEFTRNHTSNNGNGAAIFVRGDWYTDDDTNPLYRNYTELNHNTIAHNYYSTSSYSVSSGDIIFQYDDCNAIVNNSIVKFNYWDGANDNIDDPPYVQLNNTYTNGTDDKLFINSHRNWFEFDLAAHSPAIGYGVYDERFPLDRNGNPRNPDENPDAGCYESTRSVPEEGNTTIYVSTEGSDETGSGEQDNPYASLYKATRATHYNYHDTVYVMPGTYNESEPIRLRGKRVYFKSQDGSDNTELIFKGELLHNDESDYNSCETLYNDRTFTHEDYCWAGSYPTGFYENTIEGFDIKLDPSTDYGIYMYEEPVHLKDVVIEDEVRSFRTQFNIDGLRSYTEEGFTTALFLLYNDNRNEDYTFNFNNLDVDAKNDDIFFMHNNSCGNYCGRDMILNVTNSTLRAGSGSNDVFQTGCCTSSNTDDYIYIYDSFIEGDIEHRGLIEFEAERTTFKNTRFDVSENSGENSYRTMFDMKNCTVHDGYFYAKSDGTIQNTIFYPNSEYQFYGSEDESDLEFKYCINPPDDAPDFGVFNISADPLFRDADNEDYSLFPASPAIDSGNPDTDDDGDNWDIDTDDQDDDGSRFDMGNIQYNKNGAYEPVITSVLDVPDDQGGQLRITWDHSQNDIGNGNITYYGIHRHYEDGTSDDLGLVVANQSEEYNFVASTLNDSIPDNLNAETFTVSAHTADLELFYTSLSASGYSIDNIAPSIPGDFELNNNNNYVYLSWSPNTEPDFNYYKVYLNDELFTMTFETSIEDFNFGDLNYYVTAVDHNGNESEPSEILNIDLNLPGDVNTDGILNVFDIIIMVEHILYPEESSFTELEIGLADQNYDGTINVVDIIAWIGDILGLDRSSSLVEDVTIYSNGRSVTTNQYNSLVGYHIYLSHGDNFSAELTENAYIVNSKTSGNNTEIIIINPETEVLFTADNSFTIDKVEVANIDGYVKSNLIETPSEFSVKPAYPNPFNPSTNFEVQLSETSNLDVSIYDLNGRLVESLADKTNLAPGNYTFTWDAKNVSSGVYMLIVKTKSNVHNQQITLLK